MGRKLTSIFSAMLSSAVIISAQSTSPPGSAQNTPPRLFLFTNESNFQGYTDSEGRVVIKPQFLTAEDFSEGLARVGVCTDYGPREGFIDSSGEIVIPPRFDWAEDFSDGLAEVVIDGKWGFIDRNGLMVVQPRYEANILDDFKFSEGLAAVKIGEKWAYIDRVGQFVVKPKFDDAERFSEGMARVAINHKNGYIDSAGRMIIKPRFDNAVEFSEGLARINIGYTYGLNSTDPGYRNGKWGYIDRFGRVVIEPQFDEWADDFAQGRAIVRVDGTYGFINKSGQVVIDIKYEDASRFSEGLAPVRLEGKWGYIDLEGRTVIPFKFSGAESFNDGIATVNGGNNRINRNGEIIWTEHRQNRSYSVPDCDAKIKPPPPSPEEVARRRQEIHKRMLKGEYQHDGSIELIYIGDLTSVPALLRVLKDHAPQSYPGIVICTYSHAVAALQKITGQNLTKYEDWRLWWNSYQESHGKKATR